MNDDWKTIAREALTKINRPQDAEKVREWELKQRQLERASNMRSGEFPRVLTEDLNNPRLDTRRHPIPAIEKCIAAGQRMILLAGPPGTGKTVAAGYVICGMRGAQFLRAIDYATWAQSYKTQWQAEKAAMRSALLLDELGEEDDYHRPRIDHLLSGRYNDATACTTIVTTNMQVKAFGEAYGERIVSRFRDPRYCSIIACRDTVRPRRPR